LPEEPRRGFIEPVYYFVYIAVEFSVNKIML